MATSSTPAQTESFIDDLEDGQTYTLHVLYHDKNRAKSTKSHGKNHERFMNRYTIKSVFDEECSRKLLNTKSRSELVHLYTYDHENLTNEELLELANELKDSPDVKTVHFTRKPVRKRLDFRDVDETTTDSLSSSTPKKPLEPKLTSRPKNNSTPSFKSLQDYLFNENNSGLDVDRAHSVTQGEFIRIHHVDFGLQELHENFNQSNITIVSNRKCDPNKWDSNHGTASSGLICANNGDRGIVGIAPKCEYFFYDTDSIHLAVANARPGDIVSIEMQFEVGKDLAPATYSALNYRYIKSLVEDNVVTIFSAGNGGKNINNYFKMPDDNSDSTGIMCCAITQNAERIWFSNYNYYKAIAARGEDITTTGYGDLQGDDRNSLKAYTRVYGGTSAAQPQLAGCLGLIQSLYYKCNHEYLNTDEIYNTIADYGLDRSRLGIGYVPRVLKTCLNLGRVYSSRTMINHLAKDDSYFVSQMKLYGILNISFYNSSFMEEFDLPKIPPNGKYIVFKNFGDEAVLINYDDINGNTMTATLSRHANIVLQSKDAGYEIVK